MEREEINPETLIYDGVEYLCCEVCDSVMLTGLFLLLPNKMQAIMVARCHACFEVGQMAGHEHHHCSVVVVYELKRKEWQQMARAGIPVYPIE